MNQSLPPIFKSRSLPVLQNRTFDCEKEALNSDVGDLELNYDGRTGIIVNSQFDKRKILYGKDYNNEQALSASFLNHLEGVSRLIRGSIVGDQLVEIGCGKGAFLKVLRQQGFHVKGFDPAYEGADPEVEARHFGAEEGIIADGVVLRHVLEHIPEPVDFLSMIREANGGRGRIYIEVPCFEWILENEAWFDVFYEHVNYFRESDFQSMFSEIVRIERTFNGQYLSVVAELGSLRRDVLPSRAEVDPKRAVNLTTAMQRSAEEAMSLLEQRTGASLAVWGGASKGVIFSLYLCRFGIPVSAVVDINPAKQGRYLPCSGIRVQSPEEYLTGLTGRPVVVVMNPNYLNEIRDFTGDRVDLVSA